MKRKVIEITPTVKKKVTQGGNRVELTRVYRCKLDCGHYETRTWEPSTLKCKRCDKKGNL